VTLDGLAAKPVWGKATTELALGLDYRGYMAVDPHAPDLHPPQPVSDADLGAEVARLRAMVQGLEARLVTVERQATPLPGRVAVGAPTAAAAPPPPPTDAIPNRVNREPRRSAPTDPHPETEPSAPRLSPASFAAEDWLKWIGVGLVFLAMAFLVSTAVTRGWIGPELQWAGAMLVGLALLGGAVRLNATRPKWSVAMALGGVAVLDLAVAAGQAGLDLYSVSVATLLMVLTVVGGLAMGWWLSRSSVAGLAVALGVWIPTVMIIDDAPDLFTATLGAVLIGGLIAAGIGVGVLRGWTSLRLTTMIVTAIPLLLLAWDAQDSRSSSGGFAVMVLIAAVGVLYWVLTSELIPKETTSILGSVEIRVATLLPLFIWLLFAVRLDLEETSWITAVVFAGAAAALALVLRELKIFGLDTFSSHLVGAGLLLSVGLIGLIDGPVLPVLIAAQALGFTWLALREGDPFVRGAAVVLGVVAAAIAASGMANAIDRGGSPADHLAHLFVVAAGVVAVWLGRQHQWSRLLAVVTWVGLMGWIASVFSDLAQGQMLVSVMWMAMGAGAFVYGVRNRNTSVAHLGLATIGVTVVKLLTVDLGAVDTMWRAGLFLVVGLGLMRLGLMVSAIKPPPVDPHDLDVTNPPIPAEPEPH